MTYTKLTFANTTPSTFINAINTYLTSTLPVAERWTSIATNTAGVTGRIFRSAGTSTGSAYTFPLQFVLSYASGDNYIRLRSGELIDSAGSAGSTVNLVANPSWESVTVTNPDTWQFTSSPAATNWTEATDTSYIFFGSKSVKLTPGTGAAASAIYYQVTGTLAAAVHTMSCYVRMADGSAVTNAKIKFYVQDDDGAPAFNISNAVNPATITALENGWYRISYTSGALANHAYRIGVAVYDTYGAFYLDGFQLEESATLNPYTENTGANNVIGNILRNDSGEHKIFFTEDVTGITNEAYAAITADKNSVAIVMGNSKAGDKMSNAGFYGRLQTPSGDPIDANNSSAVDVTAIGIATTSNTTTNSEGQIKMYRDSKGRFWQQYDIIDAPVGAIDWWSSGRNAKFSVWGRGGDKFLPYIKNLFLHDLYWKDKINVLFVGNQFEGIRGNIPNLFTMDDIYNADPTEGRIIFSPRYRIFYSAAHSSSDDNTLVDQGGVDFTTIVRANDIVYHKNDQQFVKVVSVDSATQLTTDALTSPSTFASNNYEIYRGISFNLYKVGFKPGETTPSIGATTPVDASNNQFTPRTSRKNSLVRRMAIILSW
jgi:hypothetical protein